MHALLCRERCARCRIEAVRAHLLLLCLCCFGCGQWEFSPPEHPPHDEEEDGALHARRYETPFLCGRPDRPDRGEVCPPVRPPDDLVSCDAAGCHGTFDFTEDAARAARDLIGSDGPSCYTCHGREWED